ncbi:hypothetical protein KSC_043520 [Ktedonobacter sp. SOSP1-52]|uniref:AfsR/SARP family transcriptional regulator n=1 Tax=Ktedonobacter sp. SOSP1-52 TaxID=2778366 RepID=UPI0019165C56|nr:BTAD domain-containing putative transcriptional regulator [Ktedonobacter sp. SOSP1-52]GHO65460.1 hypothetical protein KSC_043520 [Ktedonobacter sp. SOSP1-52]
MKTLPVSFQQTPIAGLHESTAHYKAYFFGPFRVTHGAQVLGGAVWRRNKAKTLLKWFLLNHGQKYSANQLINLFWPDTTKSAAARNLHVTINYLRHLLEPELLPRQESTFIRRNKHNFYWFELHGVWWADIFDLQTHHLAAREAQQRNCPDEAMTHFRAIVQHCSPGFLPEDAYEDIFSIYRRHYDLIYIQALEGLVELCSEAALFDEVHSHANQALLVDPYCEFALKAIINAFFRQGNVTGAIRRLNDFQKLLREDLGMELGEDMLSLRTKMIGMK